MFIFGSGLIFPCEGEKESGTRDKKTIIDKRQKKKRKKTREEKNKRRGTARTVGKKEAA